MPFPGDALTRVVGAYDFFTREIAVAVPGLDGMVREIIASATTASRTRSRRPKATSPCRRRRLLRRPHPSRARRER